MTSKEKQDLILELNKKRNERIKDREFSQSYEDILQELSDYSYSSKSLFLLELIQNADDNIYNEIEVPRIRFILKSDNLIIQNNEIGFNEEDIKAICSAGIRASTKSKVGRYIGEKGLGFKSIFMITNTPEIYSNSYYFKFNKQEPLGMITPIWINQENVSKKAILKETNFILPLKNPNEDYEYLKKEFDKIDPKILLFLRKIKRIEFILEKKVKKFIKKEENGIVSINGSKWKFIKNKVIVPENIKLKRLKDQKETELIFALPLDDKGNVKVNKRSSIFVYFPVRPYGFRFIIQAEFKTTTNREDISKDDKANKWLISQIKDTFILAIEDLKKDILTKYQFFKYLPLKNEIQDSFIVIFDELYEELKNTKCLLSDNNSWCIPNKIKIIDPKIRELFPKENFYDIFDIDYEFIDPDFYFSKEIISYLDIKQFGFNDLCNLLENHKWVKEQNQGWFLKLFLCLFQYFKEVLKEKENLVRIKSLKIVKLRTNDVISLEENNAFLFPKKLSKYFNNEMMSEFNLLHDLFNEACERDKNLENFLKKDLGISYLSNDDFEEFILGIYKSGDRQEKNEKILLSTITYLKDFYSDNLQDRVSRYDFEEGYEDKPDVFNEYYRMSPINLKNWIWFKSTKGIYVNPYNNAGHIFISEHYSRNNYIENILENLKGIDYYFISNDYLDEDIKFLDVQYKNNIEKINEIKNGWIKFFQYFGVYDNFRIIQKRLKKNSLTEEELSRFPKEKRTGYEITDYEIELIGSLIENIVKNNDINKSKLLLKLLNKHKNIYSSRCQRKTVRIYFRKWKYPKFLNKSSWLRLLLESSIIPTQMGLKKPREVYINDEKITELIEEEVPVLNMNLDPRLVKLLEINQTLNFYTIIRHIKLLKSKGIKIKTQYQKFYKYLDDNFFNNSIQIEINNLRKEFNENSLIFLEKSNDFFRPYDLIWSDRYKIIDRNSKYIPLKKEYPLLKNFFVDKLEVPDFENISLYFNRLEEITNKNPKDISNSDLKISFKIFKRFNDLLKEEDFQIEMSIYSGDLLFIAENQGSLNFWRNGNNLFVNDDDNLYELFKHIENIAFLKLDKKERYLEILEFLDFANIRRISREVNVLENFDETKSEIVNELTVKVRSFLKYIKRYFYFKNPKKYDLYDEKNQLFSKFESIKCAKIDRIDVVYKLDDISINSSSPIFYSIKKNVIYLNENLINKKEELQNRISVEIEKFFPISNLADFIQIIFIKKDEKAIENYLKIRKIGVIPIEEREPESLETIETIGFELTEDINPEPLEIEKQNELETIKSLDLKPLENEKVIEWTPEIEPEEAPKIEKTSPIPNKKVEIIPDIENDMSYKSNMIKKIGHWGEKYIFEILKTELKNKYPKKELENISNKYYLKENGVIIAKLVWWNIEGESGKNHDIYYLFEGKEYFIEVKTTISDELSFIITGNEFKLAKKSQENYFIFFVFNGGTKQTNYIKINNFYQKFLKDYFKIKEIRLKINKIS